MTMENTPRKRGRPPKLHPGYGETREALVRAGVIALTQKGLPSTAIDEILESVHVPKGSFYHYFQSKEAFGAELITRYAEYFARRLDSFLLNDAHSPLDRLRAFTIDAEAAMERHAFTRGCLVGNLGQEMGSLPQSYRKQLIDVLHDWQRRTAKCLREAQAANDIAASHDPQQLAAFFWIGWEGAVLRAKLEHSGKPLRVFAAGFFALLDQ